MLVTTTPTVQGHEITKYLGVVCGEVVIGAAGRAAAGPLRRHPPNRTPTRRPSRRVALSSTDPEQREPVQR